MPDADSADVFLSYASADGAAADAVVAALSAAGVSVWRDKTHIVGGAKYQASIVGGLRAAKVVLLLCSPRSLASENVKAELGMAWDDFDKKPVLQLWLVERKRDLIPDDLAMILSLSRQYLRYHGRTEAEWLPDVLAALAAFGVKVRHVAPTPMPAPPPPPEATEVGDIFDTDFELPKMDGEEGGVEVLQVDAADSDLENSDFDLAINEGETAWESDEGTTYEPLGDYLLSIRAVPVLRLWTRYLMQVPVEHRTDSQHSAVVVKTLLANVGYQLVLLGRLDGQLALAERLLGSMLELPFTATLPPDGLKYEYGDSSSALLHFDAPSAGQPPADWPAFVRHHYQATTPRVANPLELPPGLLAEVLTDLPTHQETPCPLTMVRVTLPAEILRTDVSVTLTANPHRGDAFEPALQLADAVVYVAEAGLGLGRRELQLLARQVFGRGISPCRVVSVNPLAGPTRPANTPPGVQFYQLPDESDRLAADLRRDADDRVSVKCGNAVRRLLADAEKVFGSKPKPDVKAVLDDARALLAELTGGTP